MDFGGNGQNEIKQSSDDFSLLNDQLMHAAARKA